MKKVKVLKYKKLLAIVTLTIIAVYISYIMYVLIKEPTDTFTVEQGTVSLEETTVGYIIRDEVVVQGENYKNGMEQIVLEGERAAKDETIFRYYSNNESSLKEKIEELDVEIQEAMANIDTSVYYSEVKSIEEQIDEKVEEINSLSDYAKIKEYKKEIESLVTEKAKRTGELSPSGSYIKQLIEERSQYEEQLNSGSEYVTAPMSGVVSYRVDGLEEVLTTDDFSTLSKEYLESLNLKTGKIIATSDEKGKIIDNFQCYIAVILSSDKAKEAEVGDSLEVRLSSGEEIDADIVYIDKEDEDNILIVLELDRLTEELINYRKISVDIVWWSYTGLKIPNQAIAEEDGLQYVVRTRAGYLSKLLVKVLRQNENYSIVTTYTTDELKELGFSTTEISNYKKITMYDEILLNPDLENTE